MSSGPAKPNRAVNSGFGRGLSHHGCSDLRERVAWIKYYNSCLPKL